MTGEFAGLKAVMVGFGVSGRAATSVLAEEGASVLVTESRSMDELIAAATDDAKSNGPFTVPPGVTFAGGGHRPEHLEGADVVVGTGVHLRGADLLRTRADVPLRTHARGAGADLLRAV
jgi:UDP-N-acetylmuramoylalanine--D-glutamate ligase